MTFGWKVYTYGKNPLFLTSYIVFFFLLPMTLTSYIVLFFSSTYHIYNYIYIYIYLSGKIINAGATFIKSIVTFCSDEYNMQKYILRRPAQRDLFKSGVKTMINVFTK